MSRVPPMQRTDLANAYQSVYDEIIETRGAIEGPWGPLLLSPELAKHTLRLGTYVRFDAPMPPAHRHLIALIASRELGCQYQWQVHARLAREAGIEAASLESIRNGDDPIHLSESELLVVTFARQLIVQHRIDDETFAAMVGLVGLQDLTDIVGAIGYFCTTAHFINAFDIPPRTGIESDPTATPATFPFRPA